MTKTNFIAAIELSSSHISGIAGQKNSDGSLQVLAYTSEDASPFVQKGVVYNIDKAAHAIENVKRKLEEQLQTNISKMYVGIGGLSLRTVKNAVNTVMEETGIITVKLVDRLCNENRMQPLEDMCVLDVAPQEYKVDGNMYANPVGVVGRNITGQYLNIIARNSLKNNLEMSLKQAKISMADFIVAPVAQAKAVLTENELRSGCALVDIGADTTTVQVYKNNMLRYLCVLPLGGSNITRDITMLNIDEDAAEQLKLLYGDALYEEEEGNETPATCSLEDERTIKLEVLNDIVGARMEEIVANACNQIQMSGYDGKLWGGIVLTGGGSNLRNTEAAFRKRSNVDKVRTARFVLCNVEGCGDMLKRDACQNTLLGLLLAGKENCAKVKVEETDLFGNPVTHEQPVSTGDGTSKKTGGSNNTDSANTDKQKTQKTPKSPKQSKDNWIRSLFGKMINEFGEDNSSPMSESNH